MEDAIIVTEEILEQKTLTLYEQATSMTIMDQDTFTRAGELGKSLKALEAEITNFFEPLRITAKAAYDQVLEKKNGELAPVKEAMDIVRKTMNVYLQEQERIRQEAERKARVAAEEDARKQREKLEAQAVKAIDKGKEEKAEDLMEQAENVYVAPVQVEPTIDKTIRTAAGNITQAKEVKITVVDQIKFLEALIKTNPGAVAAIVKIGDGPLKAFVKSNGLANYPGLNIVNTVGVRL